MILPPGSTGVLYTEASDGDMRADPEARSRVSARAGIPGEWATVSQIHGNSVVRATSPIDHGSADAIWTTERMLPLAVFTADCLGIAMLGTSVVGVAHAGWRGVSLGVVEALHAAIESNGHAVTEVLIGPSIGPCCFEVGAEVAEQFETSIARTSWGTLSVDLAAAVSERIDPRPESVGRCSKHEAGFFSHRGNGTKERMATVVWLP